MKTYSHPQHQNLKIILITNFQAKILEPMCPFLIRVNILFNAQAKRISIYINISDAIRIVLKHLQEITLNSFLQK